MTTVTGNNDSYIDKKKAPGYWGLKIPAIIIFIIFAFVAYYIQGIKTKHQVERDTLKEKYNILEQEAAATDKVKKQRIDYFKKYFFLDFPSQFSYQSSDFTRRLSLIKPQDIKLTKIAIIPQRQTFSFTLTGSVNGQRFIPGQKEIKLSLFVKAIQQIPGVIHASTNAETDNQNAQENIQHDQGKGNNFIITGQGEIQ